MPLGHVAEDHQVHVLLELLDAVVGVEGPHTRETAHFEVVGEESVQPGASDASGGPAVWELEAVGQCGLPRAEGQHLHRHAAAPEGRRDFGGQHAGRRAGHEQANGLGVEQAPREALPARDDLDLVEHDDGTGRAGPRAATVEELQDPIEGVDADVTQPIVLEIEVERVLPGQPVRV